MKYRVLLVEDDKIIHNTIRNFLLQDGYEIESAFTGEHALELFNSFEFHLVLLDLMLPQISGEMVLKRIRTKSQVLVIVISALSDELTQQIAYEEKVDDYITKPFSMKILMFKIEAMLRRKYETSSNTLEWNNISLDLNGYKVYSDEREVALTTREFELLSLLLSNRGRVYTREQLVIALMGYDYDGYSRSVDVHVKNIRKKLGDTIIKTVNRVGYMVEK